MSLLRFFRRRRRDEELQREIDQHLALEQDLHLSRGLSPAEAKRRAHLRFGSQRRVREQLWNSNSIVAFEKLLRDIRYAFRTLLRSPGYTLMAVLTLGLGIGANTAIFTVINGVLLRPLPYAQPDQVVHLQQTASRIGPDPIGFSVQEVRDYREQSRDFSDLAEYHSMTFNLLGTKVPERVVTGVVSANYFNVLGVKPALGRLITPADETLTAPPVLVLSYAYWVREFGSDPKVLGRPFVMNDRVHTVIGVLSPVPDYPDANDVYMPTTSCPFPLQPGNDREPRCSRVDDSCAAQARRLCVPGTERSRYDYRSACTCVSQVVSTGCRSHGRGHAGATSAHPRRPSDLPHAARRSCACVTAGVCQPGKPRTLASASPIP